MQEEVSKALKIHKANKDLKQKNELLKRELEKAQNEYRASIKNKDTEIKEKTDHIERMQDKLNDERQLRAQVDEQNAQNSSKAKSEQDV